MVYFHKIKKYIHSPILSLSLNDLRTMTKHLRNRFDPKYLGLYVAPGSESSFSTTDKHSYLHETKQQSVYFSVYLFSSSEILPEAIYKIK